MTPSCLGIAPHRLSDAATWYNGAVARKAQLQLTRFGVSMSPQLLDRLDHWIARRVYSNRSEAIRDLVRRALVDEAWQAGLRETMATITLVYNHHTRLLPGRLIETQHRHSGQIISTLHVHLDHDHCLEVLVVRGRPRDLRNLADQLIATRGVKHGRLTVATTGRNLP
jgi:CopG family transcriptional regulator, nickel-responsive regulator